MLLSGGLSLMSPLDTPTQVSIKTPSSLSQDYKINLLLS